MKRSLDYLFVCAWTAIIAACLCFWAAVAFLVWRFA